MGVTFSLIKVHCCSMLNVQRISTSCAGSLNRSMWKKRIKMGPMVTDIWMYDMELHICKGGIFIGSLPNIGLPEWKYVKLSHLKIIECHGYRNAKLIRQLYILEIKSKYKVTTNKDLPPSNISKNLIEHSTLLDNLYRVYRTKHLSY